MSDDFNGDDAHLVSCIKALLDLDKSGSLVPHGIGGHARTMLEAAASRLEARAGEAVAEVAMTSGSLCDWKLVWFRDPDSLPARSRLYLHPPTGDAAGKDSVDAARYRELRRDKVLMSNAIWIACGHPVVGLSRWVGDEADSKIDAAMEKVNGIS